MRSRSIELAITKHDTLERWRVQRQVFKRDHALHGNTPVALRLGIERVSLNVRFAPRTISPRYALRNETTGARRNGSPDKVPSPFAAKAGIANDSLRHLAGVEILGQIGKLMDHDVRL